MLNPGDAAPVFGLVAGDGEMVHMKEYLDDNRIVLYFYPRDDTPGCTLEAREFSELAGEFAAANALVFGVSMDDGASHRAFCDKYGLKVRLLSDPGGMVAGRYGVLGERDGRPRINRSTFVIDEHGVIRHALYGVKAEGHAAEVLALLQRD